MADLFYDPNMPRRPRPIASSPFWQGSASPGLGSFTPPPDPGMRIPTPMGWLTPGMASHMLNNLAPNRETIADALGNPMDVMAWGARKLGAKGIPGEYGDANPDIFAQAVNSVVAPGRAPQPVWRPSADVPLSSANILRLLNQYVPPGGLF